MAWFGELFGKQGDGGQPEPEPVPQALDYDGLLRELLTVELRREGVTTGSVKGWLMLRGVTAAELAERLPEFWAREGAAVWVEPLQRLAVLRLEPLSGVAQQLLPTVESAPRPDQHQTAKKPAQAEEKTDSQGVEELIAQVVQAFQAGNHKSSLRFVEVATQAYSESALAWLTRAELMEALAKHEDAIASYDRALAIEPGDHRVWLGRSTPLRALGQFKEALSSCEQAIEINPEDPDAWSNRGALLYALGQIKEAISSYDQALAIKPDNFTAWYGRGTSLDALGETEEAISSFDQALVIKPNYHEALYNRGASLHALGREEEAISSYDQALAIKPGLHEAWYNRGISLYVLGAIEEAIASYDQALAIKPNKHEAWANRSIVMVEATKYEFFVAAQQLAVNCVAPSSELLAYLKHPPSPLTQGLTTCGYKGAIQTLNAGLTDG